MSDAPAVPFVAASPNPWSELLHAEVAALLDQAGIRCLHIKGPSVVTWLDPADVDLALTTLPRVRVEIPLRRACITGVSGDHATTIERVDAVAGAAGEEVDVDVHGRFEGASPTSFEDLRLLLTNLDHAGWREVVALAGCLQAAPALTVGLLQVPDGKKIVRRYLERAKVSPNGGCASGTLRARRCGSRS